MNIIGYIKKINGPVVEIKGLNNIHMMEVVEVSDERVIGEVVRIIGDKDTAVVQVYEDTTGLKPGAPVYGSGMPMSVELGPGLTGNIFDGIQRPLLTIETLSGNYIKRGVRCPSLDRSRKYEFIPALTTGMKVKGGEILGSVQETELLSHRILVPPTASGIIKQIAPQGDYGVESVLAVLDGGTELKMYHRWPIRKPRPVGKRLPFDRPLITGQRVIDTLFPIALGGTATVPGGFGTGKTIVQHQLAKYAQADVIVYIGCGERGNELTDILLNFPKLLDPASGKPLMQRTIIIANTSNMPVAAREASIYTGVTIAEYYRDMGYNVAVMADSTSRWAEALRELSGRMEEIPAEEGFPAYLPTRLAEFYERAGYAATLSGGNGSVTIIGAVSPPGGDFSEPVTQHSKRFIRCFWALDRQLANARHYPSISWTESYSEYLEEMSVWWGKNVSEEWFDLRSRIMALLQSESRLQNVIKLVGPEALPESQRFILEVCALFKNAFLQQSAYDSVDAYSSTTKQVRMLRLILKYYEAGAALLKKGVPLARLKKVKVYSELLRMKFSISNEEIGKFDLLEEQLGKSLAKMEIMYK